MQKHTTVTTKEDMFPEHAFIKTCLGLGISIKNLKEITFIDTMKIFLSNIVDNNNMKPTQKEIDMIM